MGRTYDSLDSKLSSFLLSQPVFFVATAPLAASGSVNCSPKGNRGNLAVLDERRVAYQDLTGSGVETIAHLRENGRIVLMFCAFEGPPRIVRLHGTGMVVEPDDPRYFELAGNFPPEGGLRAVVVVDVTRISDSCGYGVPVMSFEHHRSNLDHWVETKGPEGLIAYRADKNAVSIDGLGGLAPRN
jgi:hypothetical protein